MRRNISRGHHITNRLRILRAERQWTQDDTARRMGYISRFRYWQIENEETTPTTRERAKLAKIFRCTDADIFPQGVVSTITRIVTSVA